ncbi:MAG TPA: cupin domain-containing protein [Pseudonocardiaceae bacterium]
MSFQEFADESSWVRPEPVDYQGQTGERNGDYLPAGQSRSVQYKSGVLASFIATGDTTDGDFGLFQWDMPGHAGGPDLHFHRRFSESFYVLSGTVQLYSGTKWVSATAGDFLHVPRGGLHAFHNVSDAAASMLILFAPGAPRQRYFTELAELATSGRTMSDAERVEFLARHDQYQGLDL